MTRTANTDAAPPANRPAARVTRPKREDVRRWVIEGAFEAFAERGFMGASVDFICSRAGLSRGAFYSNFADKDALFFALYERQAAKAVQRMRQGIQNISNSDDPLASLQSLLAASDEDELRFDIINKEFVIYALRNEVARRRLNEYRAVMRANIVEGISVILGLMGTTVPDDLEEVARLVMAIHEGDMTQRGLEPKERLGVSLEARFLPRLMA